MYSVQIDAGDRAQRKQTGKYPHGQKFSHIQNLTEKMAKPRFGQSFLPGSEVACSTSRSMILLYSSVFNTFSFMMAENSRNIGLSCLAAAGLLSYDIITRKGGCCQWVGRRVTAQPSAYAVPSHSFVPPGSPSTGIRLLRRRVRLHSFSANL